MSIDFSVKRKHVLADQSSGLKQMPDMNRRILERLPSGRWNTPDELAGLAVFLAAPAASILTGVTIAADGGYSIT